MKLWVRFYAVSTAVWVVVALVCGLSAAGVLPLGVPEWYNWIIAGASLLSAAIGVVCARAGREKLAERLTRSVFTIALLALVIMLVFPRERTMSEMLSASVSISIILLVLLLAEDAAAFVIRTVTRGKAQPGDRGERKRYGSYH